MSAVSRPTIATDSAPSPAAGTAWPTSWQTLAQGVSVGRYTDPEFARLEFARLWSRVWQVAARVDEIPQPGDYTTYKIGDQSILVVRVDASTIKTYHNFCPHRGTTLGDGCGHFDGGKIICPYHGWRWDLAGNIKLVLERQEFCGGKLQDSDVAMREVHSRVFAGFVFINLDPNPESFDDFIAPLRQYPGRYRARRHAPYLVEAHRHSVQLESRAGSFLRGLSRFGHPSAAGESRTRGRLR